MSGLPPTMIPLEGQFDMSTDSTNHSTEILNSPPLEFTTALLPPPPLSTHGTTHGPVERLPVCDACGSIRSTVKSMLNHLQCAHKDQDGQAKPVTYTMTPRSVALTCEHCSRISHSAAGHVSHVRSCAIRTSEKRARRKPSESGHRKRKSVVKRRIDVVEGSVTVTCTQTSDGYTLKYRNRSAKLIKLDIAMQDAPSLAHALMTAAADFGFTELSDAPSSPIERPYGHAPELIERVNAAAAAAAAAVHDIEEANASSSGSSEE